MKRTNSIKEASRTTRHSLSRNIKRNRSSNFLQKIPGTNQNFMLSTYSSWTNNFQFDDYSQKVEKSKKKNFLTDVMLSVPSGLQSFNNSVQISKTKRLKTEPDCPKIRTEGLREFEIENSIPAKLSHRAPKKVEVNQFEGISKRKKPIYSVEKLKKIYKKKTRVLPRNSKELSGADRLKRNLKDSRLPKNIRSTISMPFFSNRTISQINQSKYSNRAYDGSILDVNKYKISKMINNISKTSRDLSKKVDPIEVLKEELLRKKFEIPKVDKKLVLENGNICNSIEDPSKDELVYIFEDHWGTEKLGFLDKEVIKRRERREQEELEEKLRREETTKTRSPKKSNRVRKKMSREMMKDLGNKFRMINMNKSKRTQVSLRQRGGIIADEKTRLCRKLLRNLKRLREIKCNDKMIFEFFAKITGENSALLSCFFDKNKKFNEEMNEYKLMHIFNFGGKKREKKRKVTYRFPLSKRQYIHKVLAERQRDISKIREMQEQFKHEQIEQIRLKGNITLELNMIPVMCSAAQKLIEEIQKEMLTGVADEVVIRNSSANKIVHDLRFKYSDYFGNEKNNLNKKIMIYPRAFFSKKAKDEKNPLRQKNHHLDLYQENDIQKEDIVKCYRKVERMVAPMVMRHYNTIKNNLVDKFDKRAGQKD